MAQHFLLIRPVSPVLLFRRAYALPAVNLAMVSVVATRLKPPVNGAGFVCTMSEFVGSATESGGGVWRD